MRRWSFQIGRIFGVEVRIHAFFLLLLFAFLALSSVAQISMTRVFALWLLLLFAVGVREVARAIGAAWFGLELRALLLLPTGGLMTFANGATERGSNPAIQRRMAFIGPVASIAFGCLVAAIVLAASPSVNLLSRPWISPLHLLRALVWLNLLLGVVNLLPAYPLDGSRLFSGAGSSGKGEEKAPGRGLLIGQRSAFGLGRNLQASVGQIIAIGLVLAGIVTGNNWLIILGPLILLGAHIENQGLLTQTDVDAVRMRDVMLTQFSTLSASDTLEDALQRAIHTLQDVFPVVRGGSLVGAVSRQNIVEALASEGNSYVQGVMTRSFQTAQPDDSLVKTLRRIMGDQATQLVPVMEGERIVGIITPQNLSHSMGLLNQSRRMRRI